MPTPEEYAEIKAWVRINRSVIKDAYNIFINTCNYKYNMKLCNSKYLYNDMCIYFYYALRDDYGDILFNTWREKRQYMNEQNYNENIDYDYEYDNDYEFDYDSMDEVRDY
jgi:hypothetical protein